MKCLIDKNASPGASYAMNPNEFALSMSRETTLTVVVMVVVGGYG
jgi:hypothetical protein